MRKLLLPLCFVLIFSQSESQINGRFYYNKYWELTKRDSCFYFRASVFDTTHVSFVGEVRDFTSKGKLVMVGTYKAGVKNGLFTQYYDSGQIESEGEFQNDKRVGIWKYFYENGNLMQEIIFNEDGFFINSFFDQNGKKVLENGTGDWQYTYEKYRSPERIIIEGHFANGKKDGDWIGRFESGAKIYEEKFKDGKFKRGTLLQDLTYPEKKEVNIQYQNNPFSNELLPHYKHGIIESFTVLRSITQKDYPFLKFLPKYRDPKDTTDTENLIFTVVEEMALPKGGIESLIKIINKNLKFPAEPRRMGIEGTVMLQFIVEKDGTIQNVEVIKGIHPDCDQEAIRVIKLTSPWEPGRQNSKPVRTRFVFPMKFKLG
ncbi:MAG: TonB family protein [Chryseolinea sp.]